MAAARSDPQERNRRTPGRGIGPDLLTAVLFEEAGIVEVAHRAYIAVCVDQFNLGAMMVKPVDKVAQKDDPAGSIKVNFSKSIMSKGGHPSGQAATTASANFDKVAPSKRRGTARQGTDSAESVMMQYNAGAMDVHDIHRATLLRHANIAARRAFRCLI